MAIFIPGMKCNICRKPIDNAQSKTSFPSFIMNRNDPLYIFNDASVHTTCVEGHEMGERAIKLCNELLEKISPGNRYCSICSNVIRNPEEYMNFGCLSSDDNNPLYEYNFTQYHRSCFKDSDAEQRLTSVISEQERKGVWKGKRPF